MGLRRILGLLCVCLILQLNGLTVFAEEETAAPVIEMGKAEKIKKNSAEIPVSVKAGTEAVKRTYVRYYHTKSEMKTASVRSDGYASLTGLQADTKYTYYVVVETGSRSYQTPTRTFTTKSGETNQTVSSSDSNQDGLVKKEEKLQYRKNGSLVRNSWEQVNGSWYYFDSDGNANQNGWLKLGELWYFLGENGKMIADNWMQIDNIWYFFNIEGNMACNQWVKWQDKWYWLGGNGQMVFTDWVYEGGKWYYLNPGGGLVENTWLDYKGERYYLDGGTGAMVTDRWITVDKQSYYLTATGAMLKDGYAPDGRYVDAQGQLKE